MNKSPKLTFVANSCDDGSGFVYSSDSLSDWQFKPVLCPKMHVLSSHNQPCLPQIPSMCGGFWTYLDIPE